MYQRQSNAYASSAASEEGCERMTVRNNRSACARSLKATATAPPIRAGDRGVTIVRSSNHRPARYRAISSRSDCATDDATNVANATVTATSSRCLKGLALQGRTILSKVAKDIAISWVRKSVARSDDLSSA